MKRNIRMMLSVLLVLCFVMALVPGHANAINGQATLVIVDQSRLTAEELSLLVPASADTVIRIMENTDLCKETADKIRPEGGDDEIVVEAILHFGPNGITAVTKLANGKTIDTPGHAIVEAKGEFQFGSGPDSLKTMRFGFVKEKDDAAGYRYYSTATIQILGVLLGAMAKDTVLYIDDKCYTFDENGYCDITKTTEVDELLKQAYIRATYFHGLDETRQYDTNPFVMTEHIFDFSKPCGSRKATCIQQGEVYYQCLHCNAVYTYETGYGDHSWGAWIVTTAATSSVQGVQTRTCSVCGKTETRNYS